MTDMSNITTNLLANKLNSAGKNEYSRKKRQANLSIGLLNSKIII